MTLSYLSILATALPVFFLLAIGFGLRRTSVLTEESDASLMKLVVRVLYPCLFLEHIIGNPMLKQSGRLLDAFALGFATIVGGFLVAFVVGKMLGFKKGKGLRTFSFCNGIYNYGYIAIPVMTALFGATDALGVLLVYNVGIEVAIWTVGIVLLTGEFNRGAIRRVINPPVIALIIALTVNGFGLDAAMPMWMERIIHMLAVCSIPLGLLLAGASIADLLTPKSILGMPRVVFGSIAVRLGLLPLAFLLVAAFLPGLSPELRQVLVVQAAMPAGIFPIVLSRHYCGEPTVAIGVVLSTTLASVITMPLWIQWGTAWVL